MKQAEKRKPRTYKITDAEYDRAMKRARKEKIPLTNIIEATVVRYGANWNGIIFPELNQQSKQSIKTI